MITLGHISGLYGVKGWLKIFSHTSPQEGIVDYREWHLKKGAKLSQVEVLSGRKHGKTVIAKLAGVDDRDSASELLGQEILVPREALPALADDEYYLADLLGLSAYTPDGELLGKIKRFLETGAHDVVVLSGDVERLVPWVPRETVLEVDVEGKKVVLDWALDY